MPRKKKQPLSFVEQMKRLRDAGLDRGWQTTPPAPTAIDAEADIGSLESRVRKLLGIVEQQQKSRGRMLFFVMYDIESDKVRTLIHKYLIRKGCTPIQRSIFLADAQIEVYERIKADLAEVQESYDNNDSIIVLPVSTDYLRMMKIIGQKIEVDIITHRKNTLFF